MSLRQWSAVLIIWTKVGERYANEDVDVKEIIIVVSKWMMSAVNVKTIYKQSFLLYRVHRATNDFYLFICLCTVIMFNHSKVTTNVKPRPKAISLQKKRKEI